MKGSRLSISGLFSGIPASGVTEAVGVLRDFSARGPQLIVYVNDMMDIKSMLS